jgi:hypothetical protein
LLAGNLRARAGEVLPKAEIMDDARARVSMREVASRYETLAPRAEHSADETQAASTSGWCPKATAGHGARDVPVLRLLLSAPGAHAAAPAFGRRVRMLHFALGSIGFVLGVFLLIDQIDKIRGGAQIP